MSYRGRFDVDGLRIVLGELIMTKAQIQVFMVISEHAVLAKLVLQCAYIRVVDKSVVASCKMAGHIESSRRYCLDRIWIGIGCTRADVIFLL